MAKIKIAVAGCLGRMGQEISKQILQNRNLEFVGGFEHKKHKDINSNALTMRFIILVLFVLPSFLLPCPPALCNLLAPHILYFYFMILLYHRELTTYTLFITDFFPHFFFFTFRPDRLRPLPKVLALI